jgi:phosphoglycerate dehydrogenase-like enzyme
MAQPTNVLITGPFSPENQRLVREAAPDADLRFLAKVSDAGESIADVDAIAGSVRAGDLARAPNLKWVHSWAAGVNEDLFPEMVASPVVLTSSVGNGAIPLAEHAMLLMLMLNRDVPRWMRAQATSTWDRFTHGELNGLTVGIFGVGNSGADLAAKAQAFHMRVLGLRRNADRPVAGVDRMYAIHQLHEFLSNSDFVVVTAPSTPATMGLFGDEEFRAMKRSAYYICISRGGIASDEALLNALREGWIAGAGLDAQGVEPLPQASPFWTLPNVIVTPHNGATTAATQQRGVEIFVGNLKRFLASEPLSNVVDKTAGY